jgi:hypothetical protein
MFKEGAEHWVCSKEGKICGKKEKGSQSVEKEL